MFEHIDDSHYSKPPEDNYFERRTQLDKRSLVEQYLKNGWEIISRDPLRLQRGRHVKMFRNGILIDEG